MIMSVSPRFSWLRSVIRRVAPVAQGVRPAAKGSRAAGVMGAALLAAQEVTGPVAGPEPFPDPLGDLAARQIRGEPAGRGDPPGLGVPVSDDYGALQAEQGGPAVGLRVHGLKLLTPAPASPVGVLLRLPGR